MPLSHARRPLVLVTVSYVMLLALLKAWGAFETEAPMRRVSAAARIEGTVASACLETRFGERLVLAADTGLPEPARVETRLPKGVCDALRPLPGQRLSVEGRLRPPRPALSPGDFDEVALFAGRDVQFVLQGRRARVLDPAVPLGWTVHAWAERARVSAHLSFHRRLSPDDARLLEGLLFGNKGGLDAGLTRRIQDAGVMHLLVASGTNVAFVVWGLATLLGRAGLPRRPSLAAGLLAGGFYCLMAGGDSSQIRAYGAACAGLAAAFWPGRDAGGLQAIGLAALVMLAAWPHALFSVGFQMTFAAALALWLAAPGWRPRIGPGWCRAGLRVLAISLAVQLALWPFFANVFGRGSVVGLMANVLLVPLAGAYLAAGAALWALSGWELVAWPLARVVTGALTFFKGACAFFAGLPGAAVDLVPMQAGEVAIWYAGCVALFLLPRAKPALLFAALAAVLASFQALASRAAGPRLELCFLGDRRGWATWAGLPGGEHVLVEAGLPPSKLAAALRALGAKPVDSAFVTSASRVSRRGLELSRRWPVKSWTVAPGVAHSTGAVSRELTTGFERRWGEVSLTARGPRLRAGRWPVELRFRRIRIRFMETPGLVMLSRSEEGTVEFCILQHPAVVAPPECAPAGIRGVGFEGALWIITDGDRYQIASSASGRPLGRPLL